MNSKVILHESIEVANLDKETAIRGYRWNNPCDRDHKLCDPNKN